MYMLKFDNKHILVCYTEWVWLKFSISILNVMITYTSDSRMPPSYIIAFLKFNTFVLNYFNILKFSRTIALRWYIFISVLCVLRWPKKHEGTNSVISYARILSKKMRALSMLALLKKKGGLLPFVDVPTRWGNTGTLNVLDHLLMLKDTISEHIAAAQDLYLSHTQWWYMQDIRKLWRSCSVTIRLQTVALTLGNFLKEWIRLKQTLSGESAIGSSIVLCMQEKEDKLFDNDALQAALLSDTIGQYRDSWGLSTSKWCCISSSSWIRKSTRSTCSGSTERSWRTSQKYSKNLSWNSLLENFTSEIGAYQFWQLLRQMIL